MRGEFIRGDGLVIPNNVTIWGAQQLVSLAFQKASMDYFYVGLCNGVFTPTVMVSDLDEPTAGIGSYTRQALTRNNIDWPTVDTLNGETYVESRSIIFPVTAGGYDKSVSRMFITDSLNDTKILMLGSALPTPIQITPATPVSQRTFRYRFYLR